MTGTYEPRRLLRRGPRAPSPLVLALAATAVVAGLLAWSGAHSRRLEGEVEDLRRAVRAVEGERLALEARVDGQRREADSERRALEQRLEEVRAREEELSRLLADAASTEVQSLRGELQKARDRLATLESDRAAAERIIREYGRGVCLLQGSYAFFDASGRPLRRQTEETEGEPAGLAVDAPGEIAAVAFYGTGFLVDAAGLVLTNRHLAEPWWNDATADKLRAEGFEPRFLSFKAFFPSQERPFAMRVVRSHETVDLAVLATGSRHPRLPVLPLDRSRRGARVGHPVVVVGYPTGLEAILAKADAAQVRSLLQAHGTDPERVTEALGEAGLIRPSTTQGHIGDITRTDIVFDAATTHGGSGGPVFNRQGLVVGVEYAVLSRFGGNSFGIPVGYALDLLRAVRGGRS